MPLRDPVSSLSHMVGAALAAAGIALLLIFAEGPLEIVAFAVYGASLLLLYTMSTLYHILPLRGTAEEVFRRLDHSSIYLLIAGTYTPVCLLALPATWGWSLFGAEWALAATGISLSNTLPRRAAVVVDICLYIVMGWLVVVATGPLLDVVSTGGVAWLLAGGIIYTGGAAIYATKWPRLVPGVFGSHDLWHLLVLAGSVAHFVFLWSYVLMP